MKNYNINKNLKITIWFIIIGIFIANFFFYSSAKLKIGIALGEGGERLFVHIGVLKALEREGIEIDCIAGTSAGAIVGGLYALWKDANKVEKFLLDFDFTRFYNYQIKDIELRDIGESIFLLFFWELGKDKIEPGWLQGIMEGKDIRNALDQLTNWATFEHDLKIPFKTLATDLVTGEKVIFDKGRISNAITASLSIPGTFRPFEWEGKILVDGGLTDPVPVDLVREMGADIVIGVNLRGVKDSKSQKLNNVLSITLRSIYLMLEELGDYSSSCTDILIKPYYTTQLSYNMKREEKEKLVQLGEEEALKVIPELKSIMANYP
ncbi:MAG: hypothetical protein Kow00103_09800 [Candidatus Caldatribacteriota bacterium]